MQKQISFRVVLCALAFAGALFNSQMSHAKDTNEGVIVIETDPQLQENVSRVVQTFQTEGTTAAADAVHADLFTQDRLEAWKRLAQGEKVQVVEVKIHPNQAKAVEWMNQRFKRMGLPNLQLNGVADANAPDPTSIDSNSIRGKKWLRYAAGPGIAAIASYLGLPAHSGMSPTDYIYLVIPAAGVGVTTVALEIQFAWPWLNNVFWNKVFRVGGAVGGRISNLVVNFLYGMALYGAGVGAAHLPVMFGLPPVPFDAPSFVKAVTSAAIGGLTFHIAMGQFQTDISHEQERGSITANTRYGLETTGAVVNNGARVASWVVPGASSVDGYLAQAGFFLLKTLPQLLKTNVSDVMNDREVARAVDPENAPKAGILEKCARVLRGLKLVNLPSMIKE